MSKGMSEKQILAIVKDVGQEAYVEPLFENSLESFKQAVGGKIETLTFTEDHCIVCNEEGRITGLPYNCTFLGREFYGSLVIVGVKGDEFASVKASFVPMVLKELGDK